MIPRARKSSKRENPPKPGEYIKNGKRYLRIVTHDQVRDIIIPGEGPNSNQVVICNMELEKFKEKPQDSAVSVANDLEVSKEAFDKREQLAAQSALRKKELQSYPPLKEYGPRLNKLELEAEAKSNFLLNRAKEIRQEDADEIKLCNKLILGTKCQAIRDAQVAEKKTIEQELIEEERRLDEMMEMERKKALAREKLDILKEEERKRNYRRAITEQVQLNELEKEQEAERLVEEMKIINEAAMQAKIEELKNIQKKEMERLKVREEMNRINKKILENVEQERREAKIADLRIQEFMRRKAEEEQKREEALKQARIERELELAKLRAKQQKAQDEKADKDSLSAKRQQEEYERQWRLKEKTVLEEKRRKNLQLKIEREKQIEDKKLTQAKEAERDHQETLKIEMIEASTSKKIQDDLFRRKMEKDQYKAALLKQINEKEKERIETKKANFREGLAMDTDIKIQNESLKNTIKKKLNEIRTNNVPEKYVDEIERKLQVK